MIVVWCMWVVALYAQNNRLFMNDNLYPLYLKAYNHRYDKQGLSLADSLRKQAIKANDQNGELAAMCIPVHYYFYQKDQYDTPIRDKIAISCMLRQIHEFSSHAIRHGLYIKNRKRLFCP